MSKTKKDDLGQRLRAFSMLISELPPEEREPFKKYLESGFRSAPVLLPGDPPGDMRVWKTDYREWQAETRKCAANEPEEGDEKPFVIVKDEKYKRILVIGDVHGCADHLRCLLDAVKPTKEDLIVTLGDYIDRGPYSKNVIDIVLGLHADQDINIVSLRGNHDAMLLMCFDKLDRANRYWPTGKCGNEETFELWCLAASQEPHRLWLGNQAKATLASYGKDRTDRNWDGYLEALIEEFYKGLRDIKQAVWETTADLVPQDHIDFLQLGCVDAVETDDFIFVHGGLCPDLPLADQPIFALHWQRFNDGLKPHISGKKVICGHTPQPDLQIHNIGHALCVDTGVYMAKGFLSCVDVQSGQCWQVDDLGELTTALVP